MPDLIPVEFDPFNTNMLARGESPSYTPEQSGKTGTTFGERLGSYLWGKVQGLQDIVTYPHDVLTGEKQLGSQDDAIKWALGASGLAMTGGMPLAKPGAVGMFGGRLSQTADQSALRDAERMAAGYRSSDAILKDTGWFQGADQKWRYEISDKNASYNPLEGSGASAPLSSVLNHPELYKAYPQLGEQMVTADPMLRQINAKAAYSPPSGKEPGRFLLDPSYASSLFEHRPDSMLNIAKEPTSILLHEATHGVQSIEGFARGGMPSERQIVTPVQQFTQPIFDELSSSLGNIRAQQAELTRQYGTNVSSHYPELWQQEKDLLAKQKELQLIEEEMAHGVYKRTAGETEARNVQTRFDLEQRNLNRDKFWQGNKRETLSAPWKTQDYPNSQQIIGLPGRGLRFPDNFSMRDLVPVDHDPFK